MFMYEFYILVLFRLDLICEDDSSLSFKNKQYLFRKKKLHKEIALITSGSNSDDIILTYM